MRNNFHAVQFVGYPFDARCGGEDEHRTSIVGIVAQAVPSTPAQPGGVAVLGLFGLLQSVLPVACETLRGRQR